MISRAPAKACPRCGEAEVEQGLHGNGGVVQVAITAHVIGGGVVAGRGQAGVGQGRDVQVLTEVVPQHFLAENLAQQRLVTRAEQDVVVAQVQG